MVFGPKSLKICVLRALAFLPTLAALITNAHKPSPEVQNARNTAAGAGLPPQTMQRTSKFCKWKYTV